MDRPVSPDSMGAGAGEDDPRYQKLRTEWLAGADDLATLRDMAALANDGNVAAQVTLGLIEYAFPTHYYVTNRLSPIHERRFSASRTVGSVSLGSGSRPPTVPWRRC